jgi:hypothetical protein
MNCGTHINTNADSKNADLNPGNKLNPHSTAAVIVCAIVFFFAIISIPYHPSEEVKNFSRIIIETKYKIKSGINRFELGEARGKMGAILSHIAEQSVPEHLKKAAEDCLQATAVLEANFTDFQTHANSVLAAYDFFSSELNQYHDRYDIVGVIAMVIAGLVAISSVWVYVEACKRGIKKGTTKGLLDIDPLGWFFACLGIWLIAFPLFMIRRNSLLKSDKTGDATVDIPQKDDGGALHNNVFFDNKIQDSQEFSKQAYSHAKGVTENTIDAVKILFSDPMGGQEKVVGMLGQAKAMSAGIVFIAAFVLVSLLFGNTGPVDMLGGGVMLTQKEMTQYTADAFKSALSGKEVKFNAPSFRWRAILSSAFFAAGIVLAIYLIGKFLGSGANLPVSIFTGGVAIAPLALAVLLSWIFAKLDFYTLMGGVGFFCLAISILLVNTSLVSIQKISTRAAVLLTPGTFVAAGFVMYVGIRILG